MSFEEWKQRSSNIDISIADPKEISWPNRGEFPVDDENPKDVTEEYLKNAKPGEGTITFEDGYKKSKHKEEIEISQWIHNNLGGDITLLRESRQPNEKRADYDWKSKLWELKTVSNEKSADSAVRKALKQIYDNPGGIILNFKENEFSMNDLVKIVNNRIFRSQEFSLDLLVLSKGELARAYRYKK